MKNMARDPLGLPGQPFAQVIWLLWMRSFIKMNCWRFSKVKCTYEAIPNMRLWAFNVLFKLCVLPQGLVEMSSFEWWTKVKYTEDGKSVTLFGRHFYLFCIYFVIIDYYNRNKMYESRTKPVLIMCWWLTEGDFYNFIINKLQFKCDLRLKLKIRKYSQFTPHIQ